MNPENRLEREAKETLIQSLTIWDLGAQTITMRKKFLKAHFKRS